MSASLNKVRKQLKKSIPEEDTSVCRHKLDIKYTMTNKATLHNALALFCKAKQKNKVFITKSGVTLGFAGLSNKKVEFFEKDGFTLNYIDPRVNYDKNDNKTIDGIKFAVSPFDRKYRNGVIAIVTVVGLNQRDCDIKAITIEGKVDKIMKQHSIMYTRECHVNTECEKLIEKAVKA